MFTAGEKCVEPDDRPAGKQITVRTIPIVVFLASERGLRRTRFFRLMFVSLSEPCLEAFEC